MDTMLLFRKRTPLTDDHLPWLRGGEEHPWLARRNSRGKGVVSAILGRALASVLDGSMLKACHFRSANHVRAIACTYNTRHHLRVLAGFVDKPLRHTGRRR